MALNGVFASDPAKHRVWAVGTDVAPGTPVVSVSNEPGVTLTGSGDYTITQDLGGIQVTYPTYAGGRAANEATVATDGTWEFAVTGGSSTTPNNTAVFRTSGGSITLTVGTNTPYGVVDYPTDYTVVGNVLPIKIGVFA